MRFSLFFIVFTIIANFAQAQEPPQFFTLDGRLYDTGSPAEPLKDANVTMVIQLLNPAKSCVLYEEEQTVNTLLTDGYFNVRVGSPVAGPDSTKRSGNDNGNSLRVAFQNKNQIINGKTAVGAACTYTPAAGDARHFRFIVTPATTGVTATLSPDMTIDSVPQAVIAETVQGMGPQDFIQVNANVTQLKADTIFGGSYTALSNLIAGTSTSYLHNNANGTVIPVRATDPGSPSEGQLWFDSATNQVKYYDGTSVQAVGNSGGGDPTKLPLDGSVAMTGDLDLDGNAVLGTGHITMSPVSTITIGKYTTAEQGTLVGALTGAHEGATWFNSDTNSMMFWNGAAPQTLNTMTTGSGVGQLFTIDQVPHCTATQKLEMSAGPMYAWSCVSEAATNNLADADNDTKIQVEEAADEDKIRFDTAGSERMIIDNAGSVGIGTATPTPGTRLDITGTGATASSIIIPRDTTGNRPVTGVNGMLRYNTTLNKFEAYENGGWTSMIGATPAGADTQIQFNNSGSMGASANLVWNSSQTRLGIGGSPGSTIDAQGSAVIAIAAQSSGAVARGVLRASSSESSSMIEVQAQGSSAGGSSFGVTDASSAKIYMRPGAGGAAVIGTPAGFDLRFATNNAEVMRLTSAGSVGIGTTGPTEKLEVVGGKIKSPEYCIGASCITSWPSAGTGDITDVTTSGTSGLSGGVASGNANISVNVDNSTIEINGNNLRVKDAGITDAKIATVSVDKITSGASGGGKYFAYMPNGNECANNGVLKWDNTNDRWTCGTDQTGTTTFPLVSTVTGNAGAPAYSFSGTSGGMYTDVFGKIGFSALSNEVLEMIGTAAIGGSNYIQMAAGDPGSGASMSTMGVDTSGAGLNFTIGARSATSAGAGGALALLAGNGGVVGAQAGGAVNITAGAGGSGGVGGDINLTAGAGGTGTGGNVILNAGTASGTPGKIQLMGGNVGIGTATPTGTLDVEGGTAYLPAPNAAPANANFANSQYSVWLDEANDEFEFKAKKSNGTVISRTVGVSGGGSSSGSSGIVQTSNGAGGFSASTLSASSGLLDFDGGSSGGFPEFRMRVDAAGGISWPQINFQKTNFTNMPIPDNNPLGRLVFSGFNSMMSEEAEMRVDAGASYSVDGKVKMHFATQANSSHLMIDGDGKVGIGTTSPSEKLEVVGGKIKSPEYCIGASCITSWPSGGGTPGGANTSIQYNNAGALGGTGFTYTAADDGTLFSPSAPGPEQTRMNPYGFYYNGGATSTTSLGMQLMMTSGAISATHTNAGSSWTNTGNSFSLAPSATQLKVRRNAADLMTFEAGGAVAVGVGSPTAGTKLDITGTGATASSIIIPRDTTANRPAAVSGMMRYNTSLNKFDVAENNAWYNLVTTQDTGTAAGQFVTNDDVPSCAAHQKLQMSPGPTYTWSCVSAIAMADADNDTKIQVEEAADEDKIRFDTGGTERMVIDNSGNIGIGAATPRAVLDVNGTIAGKAAVSNGTSTIDFSTGNKQFTAANCGAFQFHNMKDGADYMFVVQGGTTATCSFTAYSDAGTTGLTVHLPPDHGFTTSGKHTIYNMSVLGTHVYISWTPGY